MILPVSLPTWMIECCRPAPRVGHAYAVHLWARDEAELPELVVRLEGTATPLERGDRGTDRHPVRLDVAGLTAHYDSPAPLRGPVALRVSLHDGSHGYAPEDTPETHGTVQRLRLLSSWLRWDEQLQRYTDRDDPRYRLEEITAWPYAHLLGPANPDGVETEFWEPSSVLVDLEVPATA